MPTTDTKISTIKLTDIRCETCKHYAPTASHPDLGTCEMSLRWESKNFGCVDHHLWQKALAEEKKGGSDAKSE